MIFNSVEFLLFLPIVFAVYWLLKNWLRWQNTFVVVASYFFYGWWNWRFLFLIAFTSACSFASGLLIENLRNRRDIDDNQNQKKAKGITAANIVINLLILGVFKYYNFFIESFVTLFPALNVDRLLLNIILPVGISFYTFQALSYSIDIYRRKFEPTHDFIAFFAYVSFFPQLVAGPIERATNLLPQFTKTRVFDYATAIDGCRQMLWGFFKKMVIADRCAAFVDSVWSGYATQSGSMLFLAAVCFTFQIYGDFSGYSDIAIGTAKLFGIRLKRNFNMPYFSRDIAEFWRRWHISLTTWFRDYLYIPLGGSRVSNAKLVRNTFIIFLVSGFWHGANWTFIVWGAYHALLFLPLILLGKNRRYTNIVAEGRLFPTLRELVQMILTFLLVLVGWIIFRAENMHQAVDLLGHLFSSSIFTIPTAIPGITLLFALAMIAIEWMNRTKEHGLVLDTVKPCWLRWMIYYTLVFSILLFSFESETFIYFQF